MNAPTTRLRNLIQDRHWQKHSTFVREFNKAAKAIDPALISACPSRAQLHRWMNGQLKGLPYPDACIVLEKMFPGWTVTDLFQPGEIDPPESSSSNGLAQMVAAGIDQSAPVHVEWGSTDRFRSGGQPRALSGFAPADMSEPARVVSKALAELAAVRHLSPTETQQLATVAGNVVELDLHVELDIDSDGWSEIRYQHELFNMSDRPVTRVAREVWFENTDGPLSIEPTTDNERRIAIQRTHDTAHLAKFACRISPALQPGERAAISYVCKGGQFVYDHYWRQSLVRYTRHFTFRLRHQGRALVSCAAIEEHADGAENSADEDLIWDVVEGDVLITLARNHLRPNQAMTVRWEVRRDAS